MLERSPKILFGQEVLILQEHPFEYDIITMAFHLERRTNEIPP